MENNKGFAEKIMCAWQKSELKNLGSSRADTYNFLSSKSFEGGFACEYSVKEAVEFNSNVNAEGEGKRGVKIYRLQSRDVKDLGSCIYKW